MDNLILKFTDQIELGMILYIWPLKLEFEMFILYISWEILGISFIYYFCHWVNERCWSRFLKIPGNVLRIYKHPNYVRKQILIGYKCCSITSLSSLTLDFFVKVSMELHFETICEFYVVWKNKKIKHIHPPFWIFF